MGDADPRACRWRRAAFRVQFGAAEAELGGGALPARTSRRLYPAL